MQNYIDSLSTNPFVKMVVIAIVLDTVLGLLRAIKEHDFNSTIGIDGGIRKAAMLVSALALGVVDTMIHINLLFLVPQKYIEMIGITKLGLCEFFALLFTLYECASILKNMVLCGLPVPKRIKDFISKFLIAMTDEMPKQDNEEEK